MRRRRKRIGGRNRRRERRDLAVAEWYEARARLETARSRALVAWVSNGMRNTGSPGYPDMTPPRRPRAIKKFMRDHPPKIVGGQAGGREP